MRRAKCSAVPGRVPREEGQITPIEFYRDEQGRAVLMRGYRVVEAHHQIIARGSIRPVTTRTWTSGRAAVGRPGSRLPGPGRGEQ